MTNYSHQEREDEVLWFSSHLKGSNLVGEPRLVVGAL